MVQMITGGAVDPAAVVRVRFVKRGSLRFIAHLDLVRTVTKAISRAGIPIKYSEGFNPHPKLSFATAMSIGLESAYEFMDIRLAQNVDCALLLEALAENLTEECKPVEAYFPTTKFTDIAYSSYESVIVTEGADERLAAECEAALNAKPLVVYKRSKSGDKDTDISGGIREARVVYRDGALHLSCVLAADNAGFINPEYLLTYLQKTCGILSGNPMKEYNTLLRTGLYTKDMVLFR